jgi:hypothetical protein
MNGKNKLEIRFNNLVLVWFGLSMLYIFIGMYKEEIGYRVLGIIFALLFIFNYKPIKEKQ